MKSAIIPLDRRAFGRLESNVEAIVVAGRQSVACIVRNFSEHGALLELDGPFPAAATFKLRIDAKEVEALCEARHRNGNQIGVRFLSGNITAVLQRDLARHFVSGDCTCAAKGAGHLAPARAASPVKVTTGGQLRRLLQSGPCAAPSSA